jgi:phage terminase large subunit
MTSAHISIIPEFKEKIELMQREQDFQINKTEIYNKLSGSEILFRGIKTSSGDQTANLKSLQGITDWIVDEAEFGDIIDPEEYARWSADADAQAYGEIV